MKIKPDWYQWLHAYRTREMDIIFRDCPDGVFAEGLELGAGDGFQSALLVKYVRRLIATDLNPAILSLPSHDAVDYQVLDAEEVGDAFPPGSFDLVFSSNLLEHLPAPQRALTGIHRVLKDDGVTIHVVPSPFWKLCELLLYFPNHIIVLLEQVLARGGGRVLADKVRRHTPTGHAPAPVAPDADNNPKTRKRPHSFLYRWFIPETHGVSLGHLEEFRAFRKSRWLAEFRKADLEVVAVRKGPVASGYGFGLNTLRRWLERLGFTSEYIYVAKKRGQSSPYVRYFAPRRGRAS
ncbi:MAG: class I SAM-dependent methyltransferase [Chloroflexi bacterium]|nr:class I SAM-dependent methyltransferase [Chloroflexota bacterium]